MCISDVVFHGLHISTVFSLLWVDPIYDSQQIYHGLTAMNIVLLTVKAQRRVSCIV